MSENKNEKQQEIDTQKEQDEQIRETGQLTLDQNKRKHLSLIHILWRLWWMNMVRQQVS